MRPIDEQQRHRERIRREQAFFTHLVDTGEVTSWYERGPVAVFRRQMRTRRLAEAARAEGGLILDVGCGPATYTDWLARATKARVVGFDITVPPLSHALLELPDNVRLTAADATRLPFADRAFDAVVGNAVLHHLPLELAVPELLRVLRPGGRFCFAEPNLLNPHVFAIFKVPWIRRRADVTEDEQPFQRWSLQNTLEGLGLHEVEIRPFDFMYPVIPGSMIRPVAALGRVLEATPLLREIAGSLFIQATKQG